MNPETRTGLMATYPKRMESLEEAVRSLVGQLDILYIYCNEYDLDEFGNLIQRIKKYTSTCKIKLIDPEFGAGNVMDMGKYWAIHNVQGYVFMVDDDLVYPEDYCDRHIAFIDEYECITTVHGRSLKFYPIHSYFGNTKSINYKIGLVEGKIVDIAGTGTCAFHSSFLDFIRPVRDKELESFKGMSDIWFTIWCKERELSILAIPRSPGWMQDTATAYEDKTLYDRFRNNTSRHCDLINRLNWNHVPTKDPAF